MKSHQNNHIKLHSEIHNIYVNLNKYDFERKCKAISDFMINIEIYKKRLIW